MPGSTRNNRFWLTFWRATGAVPTNGPYREQASQGFASAGLPRAWSLEAGRQPAIVSRPARASRRHPLPQYQRGARLPPPANREPPLLRGNQPLGALPAAFEQRAVALNPDAPRRSATEVTLPNAEFSIYLSQRFCVTRSEVRVGHGSPRLMGFS
jgi:hypothetical protein